MRSSAAVPPSIEGYVYERELGDGGFADVFLYRQDVLERRVAIKVLRRTVDDEDARALFVAEANLMAKVSAHPNIVTIHTAGVSRDRRPYMVMEYYPLDHYGIRLESGPIPVEQVLAIGIKIAGAVDYTHQARVIHRDIKPANVLAGREPALTDFGISAIHSDTHAEESRGYSPAYSPKEILEDSHPGDARSDVYSLAATLWAMLAMRAPFERAHGTSSRSELVARGINDPVPTLPAGLAPGSLEAVLREALDKNPSRRPQTAKAFGQQLQSIERQLGSGATALVLLDDDSSLDSAVAQVAAAVERTKQGRGVVLDLGAQPAPSATEGRRSPPSVDDRGSSESGNVAGSVPASGTARRGARRQDASGPGSPVVESGTTPRTPEAEPVAGAEIVSPPTPSPSRRPRWPWVVAAASAAAVMVLVLSVAMGGADGTRPTTPTSAERVDEVVNPGAPNDIALAPVSDLRGSRDGEEVTFDWTHEEREGLDFIVQRVDLASAEPVIVDRSSFVIDAVGAAETPCVTVTARVQGVAQSETSAPVCVAG